MAKVFTYTDDVNPDATDNVGEVKVKITRGDVTRTFTIDLGDESYDKVVVKPLGKFFGKATEVNGQNSPEAEQDRKIRQWGRDHGYEVADRGRIKSTIRAAYFKAEENQDEDDLSLSEA